MFRQAKIILLIAGLIIIAFGLILSITNSNINGFVFTRIVAGRPIALSGPTLALLVILGLSLLFFSFLASYMNRQVWNIPQKKLKNKKFTGYKKRIKNHRFEKNDDHNHQQQFHF